MKGQKRLKYKQVDSDTELDISGWLSFRAEQAGQVPVRIGRSKKLVYPEDVYCRDSDGIPYAPESTIQVVFDQTAGNKLLHIEYEEFECCN